MDIKTKTLMERYTTKENYITSRPDPNEWVDHPNGLVLTRHKDKIKGRVLDFGCNHAATTFLLLHNPQVTKIVGLDLNQEALDVAAETAKTLEVSKDCEWLCANLVETSLEKESYDTIVSFHTIEHIYPEDIDLVLSKIYDALKPNSYFIVALPYDHQYSNPDDPHPQHVAFYVEETLAELMERNGFETVDVIHDLYHTLTGVFFKK